MHNYASLWQRITAYLIDYLVIVLFGVLLFLSASLWPAAWFTTPNRAQFAAFLLLTLPVVLYFTLTESSSWQASIGKKMRRIVVAQKNEERLPYSGALLRNGIKFLPWEIAHTFIQHQSVWPESVTIAGSILAMLLLGIFVSPAIWTSAKQTGWDWAASSMVIQKPEH